MRARVLPTKGDAGALIAQIDAVHGYPRTETGTRVGGGRHVATITTATDTVPILLKDGSWAVRSDRLALARLPVTGERDVKADLEEPADVRVVRSEAGKP